MTFSRTAAIACIALALAGCDVSTPSQVSVRQLQVREGIKSETLNAWRVDPSEINIVADAYLRNGRGPMTVTLSHRPQEAETIKQQGAQYRRAFEKQGVKSLNIAYVAMDNPDNAGKAIVTYRALTAHEPEGCTRIPGHQGSDNLQYMTKYTVGCELQTATARQIARPADLMGNEGTPDEDSKRLGTMADKYRSGTPNARMEGMNASKISDAQSGSN